MFSTLSYCFGFASNMLDSPNEIASPTFKTEDVEDQWTLVELDDSDHNKENDKRIEYPTPPSSPPIEQSWVITPPPCFNAEVRLPVEELSPMENLLIEHPSIFIKPPLSNLSKKSTAENNEKTSTAHKLHNRQRVRKGKTLMTNTKRKKTVGKSMAVIGKAKTRLSNSEFKRRNLGTVKRSAADVRKRKRVIQQPRKNC